MGLVLAGASRPFNSFLTFDHLKVHQSDFRFRDAWRIPPTLSTTVSNVLRDFLRYVISSIMYYAHNELSVTVKYIS